MGDDTNLELISFKLCPFVQRAVIIMIEKGVDFDITYIDLKNKPDWFLKLSPLGKVPVLKVGDEVLFESAVIAEYLDETRPPALHPSDPLQRARNRAWVEFSSDLLMTQFRMVMGKDRQTFDELRATLGDKLAMLEENLGDGPFFNGAGFALVDAAYAPGFMRLAFNESLLPLDIYAGLPKVAAYAAELLARPSVQQSVVPDCAELYAEYVRSSGSWFASRLT